MNPEIAVVTATILYKLASLGAGMLFCWLGYQLFKRGLWGDAGDLEAKYKDNSIVLKGAAPGTFFAVLGAVVISVALYKGIGLSYVSNSSGVGAPTAAPLTKPLIP